MMSDRPIAKRKAAIAPSVCVAVPCYNQETMIRETLESLVQQDYENLLIVVSDDGSSDGTLAIARSFEARYPGRVIVQGHAVNLGINKNLHSMHPLLKGDYLCWFAGDDICLPGKISKQVAALEADPDAVMCYHDLDVFDGSTDKTMYRYNEVGPGLLVHSGFIVRDLIVERCFIGAISVMVRQSMISGLAHRSEIPRASDWLYLIEIAHRGKVIYLDEALARYRRHSHNVSNIVDIEDELRTYEIIRQVYPEYEAEVRLGRAKLFAAYVGKFALVGDMRNLFMVTGELFSELGHSPGLILPVCSNIVSRVVQRTHLFFRTGKILR